MSHLIYNSYYGASQIVQRNTGINNYGNEKAPFGSYLSSDTPDLRDTCVLSEREKFS